MRRRIVPSLFLSALLLLPACKKKAGDASEDEDEVAAKGDDGKAAAEGKGDAEVPAEVPKEIEVPAAESGGAAPSAGGSGGGGGGGAASGGAVPAAEREDLTCDPNVEGDCLEGEQCIGAQGCDAVWQCDASIACKKGVREYCGCDGRTFEAVYGNCPWKKYEYEGPCK